MPVKRFRPITPTQRFKTVNSFDELTASAPEKSLTSSLSKSGGRNNRGGTWNTLAAYDLETGNGAIASQRILDRDNHLPDPALNYRFGARWCLAYMATGFERHE